MTVRLHKNERVRDMMDYNAVNMPNLPTRRAVLADVLRLWIMASEKRHSSPLAAGEDLESQFQ